MMKTGIEIWKDISGSEGRYQVSSFGRIRSIMKDNPQILKQRKDRYGYNRISFGVDDGNRISVKTFLTHRLVAIAFIDNPDGLVSVNHKDMNKDNNRVENLEWCTLSDNTIHRFKNRDFRNRIILNLNTNDTYLSLREASDSISVPYSTLCELARKGNSKKHGIVIFTKNNTNG